MTLSRLTFLNKIKRTFKDCRNMLKFWWFFIFPRLFEAQLQVSKSAFGYICLSETSDKTILAWDDIIWWLIDKYTYFRNIDVEHVFVVFAFQVKKHKGVLICETEPKICLLTKRLSLMFALLFRIGQLVCEEFFLFQNQMLWIICLWLLSMASPLCFCLFWQFAHLLFLFALIIISLIRIN